MTPAQLADVSGSSVPPEGAELPGASVVLATLATANFGFQMAAAMLAPMLPLIRDEFGLTYFQAGLLVSAYVVTYGLVQLPVAATADRLPKRFVAAIGLLGVALAAGSAGLSQGYVYLMASIGGVGAFGGMYRAPASTLLSQSFPPQGRGRALGIHQIGGSGGQLLSPVLAGAIAAAASWRWSFLLLSVPAGLAGALIWPLARRAEEAIVLSRRKEPARRFRWRAVLQPLFPFLLLALGEQLVSSAINAYLPLFLVDEHSVAPTVAAMLAGVVNGAGVVCAPLGGAASDRYGRKSVFLTSLVVGGPALFVLAQARLAVVVIAGMVIYGMAISVRLPLMESIISDLVPWENRTRVISFYLLLGQAIAALGTPLVGRAVDAMGLTTAFTGLAVLASVLSLAAIYLWRRA